MNMLISNSDNTIKKSLISKISSFAKKNNIQELCYTVIKLKSVQSAIITYQNSSKDYETDSENLQQEILISEDGHFSHDFKKIQNIQLKQKQGIFSEQDNSNLFHSKILHISKNSIRNHLNQIENLQILANHSNNQDTQIHLKKSTTQEFDQQLSKDSKDDNDQDHNFLYEIYENQFEHDLGIQEVQDDKSLNKSNSLVLDEYSEKQKKYQNLFEQLQRNTGLTFNFKNIQFALFKRIKYFDYYLESYIQTIDNADIFEGKYKSEDIIFRILYNQKEEELQKQISILKGLENELIKPMLINCLQFEDNNYVFVFFKKDYLELEKTLKIIKEKEWNLDTFNSTNTPIFERQAYQENIKQFKDNSDLIFEKLEKEKYFLRTFMAQGGEGLIFDGYKQNSVCNQEEYAFKIVFDVSKNEIEEEVEIMKLFEKNIKTIKLYDFIEVSNQTFILVLEKCKYSLQDQLQLFLNKEIDFTQYKLFQIITSLLDGLIQFRIYNILHLDIKPENILVNQSDDYVFTDFGISSILKDNKKIQVKGCSPQYASKEQIIQCFTNDMNINNNNISYLSDVYSLGKTFVTVLNVYKLINTEEDISVLEMLIKQNMLGPKQFNRKDCQSLYSLFYKYFSQTSFKQFLESYSKQINLILNLEIYDNNKDIPHFLDIFLCYQKTQLDIQQHHTLEPLIKQISFSLNNVGNIYRALGQNENALKYMLEALEMRRTIFNGDHPDIASSLNSIGIIYEHLGQNENALKYKLEALEMRKKIFQGDHPDISASLNNVGVIYGVLGNKDNALKYKLEALEMSKKVYKGDHPDIASSLKNVGIIYGDLGQNENALKYKLEALEMRRKVFKGDHPDIATSLNSIGITYKILGQYKNTLKYMVEAVDMRRKIFKGEHPDIASSLNNIGITYEDLGQNQKALKYKLRALQMRRNIFKEDHPDIAISLNNIGITYRILGYNKYALNYKLEALEMIQRVFKGDHPNIATSLNNVGNSQGDLGQYKNALKYKLQALEMNRKIFIGDHPDLSLSLNSVGITYRALGQNENALKYMLEALEMRRRIFKIDHQDVVTSLNNVGIIYGVMGQYQNALRYKFEALEMQRKLLNGDHKSIAGFLNSIGILFEKLFDFKIAVVYQLESLDMRRILFQENHPQIKQSLRCLRKSYNGIGDIENGELIQKQLQSLEAFTTTIQQ